MAIDPTQKVVAPDNVLVRELSGEAVLLHLDSEMYFGLDEVGCRMWTVLTTSDSIDAAYDQLLAEYEVEPEQLRLDMDEFIANLADHDLIAMVPSET